MAKAKIVDKIITQHKFSIEGLLDADNIQEDSLMVEVEEEGSISLYKWLQTFNGKYVKIAIVENTEEIPE